MEGDFFRFLKDFIEEELLKAEGNDSNLLINELITSFTEDKSDIAGTLFYPEALLYLNQSVDDFLDGDIELLVYDLKLEGLNSIMPPIDLAMPVGPHILNNTLTLSALNASTNVMFNIYTGMFHVLHVFLLKTRFELTQKKSLMNSDGTKLRNELRIALELQGVTADLAMLISILETSFVEYPVQDMTNFNCLLSLISVPELNAQGIRIEGVEPTLAISELDISVSNVNLSIECITCASPEFEDLISILGNPKASEDLIQVANQLLESLADVLKGPLLQLQLDRMLHEAAMKCSTHPNYQQIKYDPIRFEISDQSNDNGSFFLTFFVVIGCMLACVLISKFTIRHIRGKRHQSWVETLSENKRRQLITMQRKDENRSIELNKHTKALVRSPLVPFTVRLLVPICILGNIALFLSGHFSIGAFVDAEIKIAGQIVSFKEVFSFSMANSILEMWQAGATVLAIIVFLFSGVWPYIKLFTTLFLWFSSPQIVSVAKRESTLLLLDSCGKWSFADIFVLIISIVSFRINVQSPDDYSFLPDDLYAFNMLVLPKFGLYANFLAQIVSQLLSHGVIHYHRKIAYGFDSDANQTVDEVDQHTTNNDDDAKALRTHRFINFGEKSDEGLTIQTQPSRADFFVAAVAILSLVLVICGSIFPSFALEVFGLLGILVESGQSFEAAAFQEFNIFSIASVLFQQANFTDSVGDYIGLGALSGIMVATVCFVPLLLICLNLIRWFKAMKDVQRRRICVMIEIIAAWQYLEVYIVSIMIASWQLGPISNLMVNGYCGSLSGVFASLAYYKVIDGSDAQCFQVAATVQMASWLLILGAFSAYLLNHFVGTAEKQFRKNANATVSEIGENADQEDNEAVSDDSILLPMPQFTDYYRWVLRSADASYQIADGEA